jgi:uncharacterized membrane protein
MSDSYSAHSSWLSKTYYRCSTPVRVVMVVMVVIVGVAVLYGMWSVPWFSVGTRDAAGNLVR